MPNIKRLVSRVKFAMPNNPVMLRYAVVGLLTAAGVNIAANNNNLFASRVGASDYQLSLLQFLPQVVNLLILIPAGLFTDSLRNKRRMVTGSLIVAAVMYLCIGLVPLVFATPLLYFIGLLSAGTGAVMLYNISWQSYFPEVVDIRARNRVLTYRTQVSVFVAMFAPLLTGALLARIPSNSGKIAAHQFFYISSALTLLLAAYNFRKFAAVNPSEPKPLAIAEIKKAARSLIKNKAFIYFSATALFFYASWQIDWTLYYIGQSQYLRMNELMIMLVVMCAMVVQFVTIKFWSRRNERLGVVLPVTLGILGLGMCPLSMIAAVSLPPAIAPYAFLVFNSIANTCFATIQLNMFQCLLQVLDEENRGLSISLYTCLTCLSNAVMPVAGVALYKALGDDLNALRNTFWIVLGLRIVAAALWLLRWRLVNPGVPLIPPPQPVPRRR